MRYSEVERIFNIAQFHAKEVDLSRFDYLAAFTIIRDIAQKELDELDKEAQRQELDYENRRKNADDDVPF